jgi:phage baseplate assembly protein W
MPMEYLALPLVLRQGYLPRANLYDSITYSVGLILSTRVGSMRFAPEYGCQIWEREFADLYTANRANIRANLRNALDKFEKRLYQVSVEFTPSDAALARVLGVTVRVSGNYKDEESKEQKFDQTYHLG